MNSISEFLGLELENEDLRKEITDLKEANRVLRLKTAALEDKAEQSETYHTAYTRQTLSLEKANTYIPEQYEPLRRATPAPQQEDHEGEIYNPIDGQYRFL
jgi:hypothetical protein